MISDRELFPEELLAAAGLLQAPPEKNGLPFSAGRHRSPRRGSSAEFQDYRSYVPGDDLRRIDWNVYRRFRKLFLRQYREFPQKKHLVILDDSPSIRFTGERAALVWRLAALICGTLLMNGDCVALRPGTGAPCRSFAPGRSSAAPLTGELLAAWHRKTPGKAPDFQAPPNCNTWIISDFLDPEGLDHLERCFRRSRGFTPVRIFEKRELHPELAGESRFIDAESGSEVIVSPGAGILAAYAVRLRRFEQLLALPARRAGSAVYGFDVDLTVPELLRQCAAELFPGGRK